MGRSVSYPTRAAWVLYCAPDIDGQTECEQCPEDAAGHCAVCGGSGIYEDREVGLWRWEIFVDSLGSALLGAFPSLEKADKWVGREDHAIAENRHAYFGISEYSGVVSFWCLPKDDDDRVPAQLRTAWANRAKKSAQQILRGVTGELALIGYLSDGTSAYRRVA